MPFLLPYIDKSRSCLGPTHSPRLLKQLKEYWQAKLILVTITKPYFRVIDPQVLFEADYSFVALEDDCDFHVTSEGLKEFVPLVRKFLMNGKTAHQDFVADSSAK